MRIIGYISFVRTLSYGYFVFIHKYALHMIDVVIYIFYYLCDFMFQNRDSINEGMEIQH